jgi:hypothetical protein
VYCLPVFLSSSRLLVPDHQHLSTRPLPAIRTTVSTASRQNGWPRALCVRLWRSMSGELWVLAFLARGERGEPVVVARRDCVHLVLGYMHMYVYIYQCFVYSYQSVVLRHACEECEPQQASLNSQANRLAGIHSIHERYSIWGMIATLHIRERRQRVRRTLA